MKLKLSIQTIACAILCISLFSCKGKNTQGMGGFAREYAVMTLQPSEMEWFSNYPARIKGRQDIEIRPNVSGFLTELLVDEGSLVKKGDVLFVVDTIPYKAALKIAEANVEAAKASTETARLTAENKRELQKKGIGIEMCPISNLQTKAVGSTKDYPMREFLNVRLKVTVNTDNRTVSNTTLTKELEFIQKTYGITDEEIHLMMRNAVDVAFADDAVKERMLKYV